MDLFQAVMIGALQGIFEWLPVSSQGQLTILMVGFFGFTLTEALNYAVFLHLGTTLAAIVYFKQDILKIVKDLRSYLKKPGFSTPDNSLISFILISTIITGFLGYLLLIAFESSFSEASGEAILAIFGLLLIFTGLLQKGAKPKGSKPLDSKDSLITGLLQSFSALPGISRSGITVSSLLMLGHDSKEALRLSFLISIPVVLGAQVGLGLLRGFNIDGYAIAALASSFLAGLLSLKTFLGVAERISFWKFCAGLGLVALLPLLLIISA